VLDDVVIKENAYTAEGRNKVKEQYSLLASIETTGAREWIVGTRYHPKDLYTDLIQMEKDVYNKAGELVEMVPVYEVMQRQVEDMGDGSGQFLWPRQQRTDGKWFGFDNNILAGKRAKYLDKTQYRAQYYNDPNDPAGDFIDRSKFQYYTQSHVVNHYGDWYYKEDKLNVYASIDFAFSKKSRADYTSIVVIGINKNNSIFILGIDRFKTDKISDYFKHIRELHIKWGFRKLRAETNVAQKVIVRELKDYIQKDGLYLSVDENSPSRHNGSKEERIAAILEPRYDNMGIWHYRGGNCEILEEELILAHPPHDDIKDALAAVVEIAVPPLNRSSLHKVERKVSYHPKFGGAY
jgi:ribosomal protein L14